MLLVVWEPEVVLWEPEVVVFEADVDVLLDVVLVVDGEAVSVDDVTEA